MPRIVLADDHILPWSHQLDVERWQRLGGEVQSGSCETEEDLIRDCADCDVLVYFGNDLPLTARVLAALTKCLLIQRVAVGVDSVDVEAATREGIIVANSAGYCDEDVANHALAMLLALHQQLTRRQDNLQNGLWHLTEEQPTERLSGRTVGVVGLGRIGATFCRRVRPLVARVLASDPYIDQHQASAAGAELVSLEEVLSESDLISLHCPLTRETRNLIDEQALALMKPGACLVNTARGPIVSQEALYNALREGRLRAAALDVFESEPPPRPLPALFSLPNVIATPHCAAASPASRRDLWRIASESVAAVLEGRVPETIVNPDVVPRLA
jgi:D-3-phosphoglycerate dehydrogenase